MKSILVAPLLGVALAAGASACAKARAEPPAVAPTAPAAAPAAKADAPGAPGQTMANVPAEQTTLRGELVDLNCYLDHGAKGEHHKACATRCALKGLPIGLLDKDNKITLVVGAHEKPINTELAEKMGTTVQLTGKLVARDGLQMIEVSGVE